MKNKISIAITALLLGSCLPAMAQTIEVTMTKLYTNKIQIIGTATAPGFSTSPATAWSSMNLTWRIPKSATTPAPTVAPPAVTPEVTEETTAFTGTSPRDGFNGGLELAVFDLTAFGQADDGYWYFQVTGTTENVQSIPTGTSVVLYEFALPETWACAGCVELLLTDIPGLPIGTTSFIDNGGTGTDVLQLAVNNAPLPVSWMYVNADAVENRAIIVKWATAMEQNNAGFVVERSEDGNLFRTIASLPGKGNSSIPSYYSIEDADVVPGVKYYYRIRQTDLDGRARYSATVHASVSGNVFVMGVNPNPVRDVLNIELRATKKQDVQLMITDISGKLYRLEQRINILPGANRYTRNVAHYPAGTYVAKVIAADGTTQTVKFIVE